MSRANLLFLAAKDTINEFPCNFDALKDGEFNLCFQTILVMPYASWLIFCNAVLYFKRLISMIDMLPVV